ATPAAACRDTRNASTPPDCPLRTDRRPEGDARTEQVGVLLPVVGERRRCLRQVLRREGPRAEETLRVAGRARIVVHDHVGRDVTHEATVRVAGAHAGIYRRDEREADVVGAANAVAHAEVELDAVVEVVMTVE